MGLLSISLAVALGLLIGSEPASAGDAPLLISAEASGKTASAVSAPAQAQSAADLRHLSSYLIHHFDCTAAIVIPAGAKEEKFEFAPVGGQQPQGGVIAQIDNDKIEASGNAQMLKLDWRRGEKLIASGMMVIKNSPTQAFVLLLGDPADDSAQASVNCVAVTYAEIKAVRNQDRNPKRGRQ